MSQEIPSPTERDYHLEKQRERSDQMAVTIARETARKAEGAERRQAQRQSALEETARQQAYEAEHGITAARERASKEWHRRFEAETERQVNSLKGDVWTPASDPQGRTIQEVARERARAVLAAQTAEAQPESLEAQVARLTRQVAAIDEFLRGVTQRYSSAA